MRWLLPAGVLGWCFTLAPMASAADYRVPETCPDVATFHAAVSARTDQPIPADAHVHVVRRATDYEGSLSLDGRRRALAFETCAALIDALALSLALQLEREPAAASSPPTPSAAAAGASSTPLGTPSQVPLPAALPPSSSANPIIRPRALDPASEEAAWTVDAGFGLAARWGRGRAAQAEPSVFAGVQRMDGWWSFALRAAAFRSQSGELVDAGLGTARLAIAGGRAEVCPLGWSFSRTTGIDGTLHPCGSFEVGRIEGVGKLATDGRDTSAWFAAGATLRLAIRPIRVLGVEAVTGLSVPLARYRLGFELPAATVYDVPKVGGHVGGALFLYWP